MQACRACGHLQLCRRTLCSCWSEDLGWQEPIGAGAAQASINVPGNPARRTEAPYAMALVEHEEGHCLLTGVLGQDPYVVHVGQRVRFIAQADGDPAGLNPYFLPENS